MDPLANALSKIKNAELAGKEECYVAPASNLLKRILKVMQRENYIGEFEYIDNRQGGEFRVELTKRINSLGVIKPRFFVKKDEFEKWEKRYLPAKGFGILIVSTSKGVMTHQQAKEQGIGGCLLAFCY